jgi:hypothetical protein
MVDPLFDFGQSGTKRAEYVKSRATAQALLCAALGYALTGLRPMR